MKQFLLLIFIISSTVGFAQRTCSQAEYEQQILSGNPQLKKSYNAVEAFTRLTLNGITSEKSTTSVADSQLVTSAQSATGIIPVVIVIPVVVHVLYNTALQNISDAQIMSQIAVLNRDFRGTNADRTKAPSYFAPLAGDAGFEFRLAKIDPNGYSTTGIVRKQTSIQMFGLDDRIKSNTIGGDDAWDSKSYLNIWVGNIVSGILGYTSKPGGPATMDGVVINYAAFGTMGTAGAPFNLGRTATHEIGHWLNLRHTWADAYCGDDEVDDTPQQRASNTGCPEGEKFSCGTTPHGDMYMNFMDLTNDACMYMFTYGQCQRMRALFAVGGFRQEMLASNALTGTAVIPSVGTQSPTTTAANNIHISVYPNPAESFITISTDGGDNVANSTISIYNNVGQPMITKTLTGSSISINISLLLPGIYFIRQVSGETVLMTRFVKK